MAQSHDNTIRSRSGNFQCFWNAVSVNNQRMIARGTEAIRQAVKDAAMIVANFRRFAMHEIGRAHNPPAEYLSDCLVPKADTKYRNFPGKLANHCLRNPGIVGCSWTG